MKTLFCGVVLGGLALVGMGCTASVEPNHDSTSGTSSTYEKKTVTTEHPNGTSETHTEMHRD